MMVGILAIHLNPPNPGTTLTTVSRILGVGDCPVAGGSNGKTVGRDGAV